MITENRDAEVMESVSRLSKDLRNAAALMTADEARFLVDNYYVMQRNRLRAANQIRAMAQRGEPHGILTWLNDQGHMLERIIRATLGRYASGKPVGKWMLSIDGLGPVISAGLLAYINIRKAPTVGHIYSYAGLNQGRQWYGKDGARELIKVARSETNSDWEAILYLAKRYGMRPFQVLKNARLITHEPPLDDAYSFIALHPGANQPTAELHADNVLKQAYEPHELPMIYRMFCQYISLDVNFDWSRLQAILSKRPWNSQLKTLLWKLGESFVKVSNKPDAIYGHLYAQKKQQEWDLNLNGKFQDQARKSLKKRNFSPDTTAYVFYSGLASVSYVRAMLDQGKPIPQEYKGSSAPDCVPMLPPAHIYERAKRWAVKIFLSNLHEVWYIMEFGKEPHSPYPFAHLGHVDKINPPKFDRSQWLQESSG